MLYCMVELSKVCLVRVNAAHTCDALGRPFRYTYKAHTLSLSVVVAAAAAGCVLSIVLPCKKTTSASTN